MKENSLKISEEARKDRNEAFSSMDKDKILAYCRKYKILVPEKEDIFWAGVHKTVCMLYETEDNVISDEQYNNSINWLTSHGYNTFVE